MFSQQIFLNRAIFSGFLTKPVDNKLLHDKFQKIVSALPFQEQPSLVLKQKGVATSIPHREIYYVRSKGHTIHVHTAGEVLSAYERLENIKGLLPTGFYQCHKSFIVNMAQVRRFESDGIFLKNGDIVPVSRAKYADTKDAYFRYMGQKF